MKKRKIAITSAVIGVASALLATSAAFATTENVGGGKWQYGVGGGDKGNGFTYSYYLHNTKKHTASACGPLECFTTGWTDAKKWAKKDILKYAYGNRAYWNTK